MDEVLGRRGVSATMVVVAVALAWGSLRTLVLDDTLFPLTYVLPLLVAVWTRRRWHVWGMAVAFLAIASAKVLWLLPDAGLAARHLFFGYLATWLNIVIGASVVHVILELRDRIDAHAAEIERQNGELEAQAEELLQQNEEIRAQAEELTEQNGEIESQTEELDRQNHELQEANERLSGREHILEAAVAASREAGGAHAALTSLCENTLATFGAPAVAIVMIEVVDGHLQSCSEARKSGQPALPEQWPAEGWLGAVALKENRTAYVDDLRCRPALAGPFAEADLYRSALMTPVRVGGREMALLMVCSRQPTHWTPEQIGLVEWAAAIAAPLIETRRVQDALRTHAEEVESANRAKDQFLAMLSHELRTPLTPVLAAAGALEHDPRLPEDAREELVMIQRNVAVQSRLIDDLLDLTRIVRGKLDFNLEVLAARSLLRESAAIVAADLDAKEQTLDMNLDLPPRCAVRGDGARLRQVFWNLLQNAVRFSPRHGRISLSARVQEAEHDGANRPVLLVDIMDEGVGIDPQDIARIFEPFEQAVSARRRGGTAGLGLGLSIANAIVELHGGRLHASSQGAGRGSIFTVELPLSDQMAPDSGAPFGAEGRADPAESDHLRILLVEDHSDTGMVMARLLRRSGHMVSHAENLTGAMKAWEAQPFDLLISDLGLPDGSGLDLMRRIQARHPGVPGICMSGFGMESDVDASRAAGFTEHFTKPVDMQQLYAAIQRLTRDRRLDRS